MYPDQPIPPTPQPPQQPFAPASVDYLNQIAPQTPQKKPFSGLMKLIVILGVVVVIVIIVAVVFNIINNSQRRPIEQLSARLLSTESIAKDAQLKLKSSQLRSANGNLQAYFTNTNRDLAAPLAAVNVDTKKLSEAVTKEEADLATGVDSRLEDARLNAIYDRTYAREMSYQLATLMALMQQVYGSTSNSALKQYLEGSYKNLEPLQKSFADFNETTV